MAYIDKYGIEYSDDKKTLVKCPKDFQGAYSISEGVTTIGDYAFLGCCGLQLITIPNSVITIGIQAFCGCSGLISVTSGNSVTTIKDSAFYNCSGLTSVTIPNSVTTIEYNAFEGCSSLTSIEIPNSITTIGDGAFSGCSGLISVTIPSSITTIGENAFEGCSSLKKTNYTGTIADWCKIQFDGGDANPIKYSHNFYINDVEIKDLVIPEGVEAIGEFAFYDCSGLTSITIGNSVTTIGKCAFYGCSGLTSVMMGNSVTMIGDFTFRGCSELTSVTIGFSVTTIGDYAFARCSGLTSVTIPNSVTTIGRKAFERCSSLQGIGIPQKIKYLHEGTFAYCENLLWIQLNGELEIISHDNLFFNQLPKEFQLVVPKEKLDYYKNSVLGVYKITDTLVRPNRTWEECVDQWVAKKRFYTSGETRLHKSITELLNKGLVPSSFPPFGIELTVFEYKEFKKEGRVIKSIEGWCESGIYIHQCVRRWHNSGLDFFDENSNWMGERTPRKGFYKVISKSDDGKILNCYYNYKRGNAFLEEIVEINSKPFYNKSSIGPKHELIQVNDIIEVMDTRLSENIYDGQSYKAYRIVWGFVNDRHLSTPTYTDSNEDRSSYAQYGGYNDWDDDTIDSAFEGDPEATWNID